jgi:hypothetical protein
LTGITTISVQQYTVTVGGGGTSGVLNGATPTNGGNSIFSSFTALGGGHGGYFINPTFFNAGNGGSGGGAMGSATFGLGTSGQGNNGATSASNGGGGGGAGAAGSGTAGGAGLTVFGQVYAKGGDANSTGAGTVNTGNGANAPALGVSTGFNGGSGIVIVRYAI